MRDVILRTIGIGISHAAYIVGYLLFYILLGLLFYGCSVALGLDWLVR